MAKDKKNATGTDNAPEKEKSTKKVSKSDKKSEKKAKKNAEKKSLPKRIGQWFKDLRIEFRNVTWPSKNTVLVNTGVVLSVIVAGSVLIGLMDLGFLKLMDFLISLSQ